MRLDELRFVKPEMQTLNGLGFSSHSKKKPAKAWLDDLELETKPVTQPPALLSAAEEL